MSEYEALLKQLRDSTKTIAKNLIPKLYKALLDENKTPDEARIILEHDIGDIFSKVTIRKELPDEAKDAKKAAAGKKGNEKRAVLSTARKEAETEPEIAKEEPKPERIVIDTSGTPISAEEEGRIDNSSEHDGNEPAGATQQWKEQAETPKPEIMPRWIRFDLVKDNAYQKLGMYFRNGGTCYLAVLDNNVIGMESATEYLRKMKAMEAAH